ncbi:DNA-binding GntR family transcriptional regulator [Barrientosiimonas humi]|uniref:DNA-binding GntR family transcriptional regulator n=1 Tax=Barrientosiimonas humi TaxID=999931 RepID=A0A542X8H0_9MICO|nr:GntR family transcriptional regulator [Barrientosiimonas humi]TQL32132.1 DNA-binding GntR family transcriptional regulator [Barrientosiimonas humi]CAG7572120.1 putative D-xylose utilization operon transcriptional repressor [Barrientosiimonas humi]
MAQTAALSGLRKTNLREQALLALRRAISTGELAPGTHLVETDLSERLGISRGTLREAMRQLQQEGIVSAGPRGRLSVRTLDAQEVIDLFAVRAALEALAAQTLSTADDNDAALDRLRESVQTMADLTGVDLEQRIEADLAFHLELVRVTGNASLLHSWQSLEGAIRMSFMWAGHDKAAGNMRVDRHRAIVDAIADGDPEAARACVVEHMREAVANLVQ